MHIIDMRHVITHLRTIGLMIISNVLSYDGTMKQQTNQPKKEGMNFILDESCWINVKGNENPRDKDHFVLDLLKESDIDHVPFRGYKKDEETGEYIRTLWQIPVSEIPVRRKYGIFEMEVY